jgi:hypothetical protein
MSQDASIQVLHDLKKNLVSFFDELIDMFPSNSEFLSIKILIKDRAPITEIMSYFVTNVLPEKELIKNRSDSIFMEKNVLFSLLGPASTNMFKTLWKEQLDKDDKNAIWKWIDMFVFLAEKYKRLTS